MPVTQIRPATVDDAGPVERVITAAFGDDGPGVAAVWRDVVARGLDRASLVAIGEDDEVVGHVGLSHGWLDARPRLVDVLVLSPLSVTPGRQRDGIGTALLAAAGERARVRGGVASYS